MYTENVNELINPLSSDKVPGFSKNDLEIFASLEEHEIVSLAQYRGVNERTILHRLVLSGAWIVGQGAVSLQVGEKFSKNIERLFAEMSKNKTLKEGDDEKLTSRVINNPNEGYIEELVRQAHKYNLGWVFHHLPTIATYVDVQLQQPRIKVLTSRGMEVPSEQLVREHSQRQEIWAKQLESVKLIRDHAVEELSSTRRSLDATQRELERVKRERDEFKQSLIREQDKLQQTLRTQSETIDELFGTREQVAKTQLLLDEANRRLQLQIDVAVQLHKEQEKLETEHKEDRVKSKRKIEEVESTLEARVQEIVRLTLESQELTLGNETLKRKLEDACDRLDQLPRIIGTFQQGIEMLQTTIPGGELLLPPKKRLVSKASMGGLFDRGSSGSIDQNLQPTSPVFQE